MALLGLVKLNRKLKTIPVAAKTAARKAVVEGMQEVVNLQQNLAPYDDGELMESIVLTGPNSQTPKYSQPGGQRKTGDLEAISTAGNTKVRYAHLVEFGTAPHAQGGMFEGTMHPGTAPQPFFWPAWRALRTRVRGRVTRSINKAIKQAAASGGSSP